MEFIAKGLQLGLQAIKTWGPGLVKGTASATKSLGNFAAKHPKFSFGAAGIGVGMVTGQGALRTWAGWLLPGTSDDTLAEKVNKAINGSQAEGGNIIGDTIDSVAGDGTSKSIADTVKNTKDTVVNGVDAARGFVADHMPGMPSMNQYADQQMAMQGQYPAQVVGQGGYPAQQHQMTLADFSPFTGFKNLLNTVTGGNTNMMSVAAMIPAAMLMFGNFGWMGKIASLMLGSLALKNMNHPAPQQNMQMQYQPQMVQEQYQQNYLQQLAQADDGAGRRENDDHVIMRGRG